MVFRQLSRFKAQFLRFGLNRTVFAENLRPHLYPILFWEFFSMDFKFIGVLVYVICRNFLFLVTCLNCICTFMGTFMAFILRVLSRIDFHAFRFISLFLIHIG